MNDAMKFSGKVVLVTGGTKGIGKVIAEKFLAQDATVIVCGRNQPPSLPQVSGRQALFHATDVRDNEAVDALFQSIADKHGRLDILINNAGGTPFVMAADASPRFNESIFRLNLIAPLVFAQKANAIMQGQPEGGVIVFIGSIAAGRPQPGTAVYAAAKAGILSLVKSLAVEWAPKIRVVSVSPGYVRTEQTDDHYGNADGVAAVAATVPLQRMAEPADIGDACLFMASAQASYISGIDLLVHGGGERPVFLDAANSAR